MKILIGVLLVLFAALAFTVFTLLEERRSRQADKRELHWYKQLVQTHTGWSIKIGNYKIVSFDHGQTWFDFDYTDDAPTETKYGYVSNHGFKIIGPADPDKVKSILGMASLFGRAESGPIDLTKPEDRKILEAAGFEIK